MNEKTDFFDDDRNQLDDDHRRLTKAMQVSVLEAVCWLLFVSLLLATPFWLGRYYLLPLFYAGFAAVFFRLARVFSWPVATAIAIVAATTAAAVMNFFWQGM